MIYTMTCGVENFDFAMMTIADAAMIMVDVTWLTLGVWWLFSFYMTVQIGEAREIMLGM